MGESASGIKRIKRIPRQSLAETAETNDKLGAAWNVPVVLGGT